MLEVSVQSILVSILVTEVEIVSNSWVAWYHFSVITLSLLF